MGEGTWAPIGSAGDGGDSSGGDPRGDASPPPSLPPAPPESPPTRSQRRVVVALATVAAVGLIAAVGVVVLAGGASDGDDRDRSEAQAGDGADRQEPTEQPPEQPPTPSEATAMVAERLVDAGSFSYGGTVRSAGFGKIRPGIWREGDLTVEGEVHLPDWSREVAVDGSGHVVETITEPVVVWSREAPDRGSLPGVELDVVQETSGRPSVPTGAALLPNLLRALTDERADGTDDQGRSRFRGTIAASEPALGGDWGPVGAELVLTVDGAGDPVRIALTAGGAQGPLVFDLAISRLAEPVTVDYPAGYPFSVLDDVTPDAVRAAGLADAVELGRIPSGWILYDVELTEDQSGQGCASLDLQYQDTTVGGRFERYISLDVVPAACQRSDFGTSSPQPVTLGSFTGTMEEDRDGVFALVSDGRVNVTILTDLSSAELSPLFAAVEPFDPASRPVPIDAAAR